MDPQQRDSASTRTPLSLLPSESSTPR